MLMGPARCQWGAAIRFGGIEARAPPLRDKRAPWRRGSDRPRRTGASGGRQISVDRLAAAPDKERHGADNPTDRARETAARPGMPRRGGIAAGGPVPMIASLPFEAVIAIFAACALVIAVCGVFITEDADRLADRTGLGEALVGGVVLGMATSLSGTVVSVTAALDGRASLAFSNGVGGIAAQTAFLAVADIVYRKANLEHAAADLANVLQAALLVLMLSLPLVAMTGPEVAIFGVHPVSLILPVIYVLGTRASARTRSAPMWRPVRTPDTREDRPEEPRTGLGGIAGLALRFAVLVGIVATCGWAISKCGGIIADRAGISETAVGALMTAVVTSLPELVTTIAAVRRGAVQLAVGGIIGGNAFDVLFLTAGDVAYRDGSLYHAITVDDLFWIGVGQVMTVILLIGLIVRERRGPAGIGFESMAILPIYLLAVALQAWMA